MAVRSKRPCRRCSTLTDNKSGLCDRHQAAATEERKRCDRERDKPFLHLYSTTWKKARLMFLRANPLCVECQKEGKLVQANVVDHIQPHRGDMNLFWDQSNWQSLCTSHHSTKTASEDAGFGNRRKS